LSRNKVLLAAVSVICLTIGLGLIFCKPVLMGEEWIYRNKASSLLDRTDDLLDQYSKTIHEYLDGTIDNVTLRFRRFDSYSSIKIIDGEAHRLTPLEGYEDFHDHVITGIHLFYDMMFYSSTNESDIDAAVNEINYTKSTMPVAKTPKPTDLSLFGKLITFVGVIALVALASPFNVMLWVNVVLAVVFGVSNFLDWNAASVLANVPCDWNVFFIATARTSILNLSLIVFLITLIINQTVTRIAIFRKLGVSGLLFIIFFINFLFLFTVCFICFNFSDFNSLPEIFSSSSGDEAYQSWRFFKTFFVFEYIFATGDGGELWKGFVNLSMITFLATISLNLYLLRRITQQSLDKELIEFRRNISLRLLVD